MTTHSTPILLDKTNLSIVLLMVLSLLMMNCQSEKRNEDNASQKAADTTETPKKMTVAIYETSAKGHQLSQLVEDTNASDS